MLSLISITTTLKQLHNKMGKEEPGDETRKQLERCPLRVEELDHPGHLLIEVTDAALISFVIASSHATST